MGEYTKMTPDFFNSLPSYEKFFLSIERQFDYDYQIACLNLDYQIAKRDIMQKEADYKVLVENGDSNMMDMLYMEADKEASEKEKGAIMKVIDSILKFIQNIKKAISDKVKRITAKLMGEELKSDEYMKSATMDMQLNFDYQEKMSQLESKMTEGEKLIRSISKKMNVKEEAVQGFVNSCNKLVDNIPELTCKAVKAGAAVGGIVIAFRNYGKLADAINRKVDKFDLKFRQMKANTNSNSPFLQRMVLNAMMFLMKRWEKLAVKGVFGMASIMLNDRRADHEKDAKKAANKEKVKNFFNKNKSKKPKTDSSEEK